MLQHVQYLPSADLYFRAPYHACLSKKEKPAVCSPFALASVFVIVEDRSFRNYDPHLPS